MKKPYQIEAQRAVKRLEDAFAQQSMVVYSENPTHFLSGGHACTLLLRNSRNPSQRPTVP